MVVEVICGVSGSMSVEIVTSDEGQELAIQCSVAFYVPLL